LIKGEQSMGFEPLMTDTARLCYGLSKLGHTPPTAIINVIGNAVEAGATHIRVRIIPENDPESNDSGQGNVREYLIIDDRNGMDEQGIKNALTLWAVSGQDDLGATPE
jgi:hypothetical protein